MNGRELNYVKMLRSVVAQTQAEAALFANKPRLSSALQRQAEKLQLIDANHQIQLSELKGFTAHKESLRNYLEVKVTVIGKALGAMFTQDNNQADFAKARSIYQHITRCGDAELPTFVNNLLALANKNTDGLAEFSISVDALEELKSTADTFKTLCSTNELNRDDRTLATKNIRKLIAESRLLFANELDLMLASLKETEPHFYEQYLKAREIGGFSRKSTAAEDADTTASSWLFTNALTNAPIEGVSLLFDGKVLEDTSDEAGELYDDEVSPGTHQCTASAPGYASKQFSCVASEAGKAYTFEHKLTPES